MARRNIKIDLRLNEQEMERLRRDVARSGWSREKYLRALIEHSSIREMPSMDLISVLRNLQQINNNMNQVALIANVKGFVDTTAYWENVELLKETIHELLEVMYGSLCYALAIGVYLSTQRNYRRREEHGSAKWG